MSLHTTCSSHHLTFPKAWDIYYNVYRKISKMLSQLTMLELEEVSPRLLCTNTHTHIHTYMHTYIHVFPSFLLSSHLRLSNRSLASPCSIPLPMSLLISNFFFFSFLSRASSYLLCNEVISCFLLLRRVLWLFHPPHYYSGSQSQAGRARHLSAIA